MPEQKNRFLKPTGHLHNLRLLEEISKNAAVSQRKLSQRLGIALGLTNTCMRRMINKGLVKAKGINHKRIAYYLTPKGLSEKTRLTYHFLQHSIRYYSNLKNNINAKLSLIARDGHSRIVFYGAGEIMEVAFIILNETNFKLLGIVDDDSSKQGIKRFGFEVLGPQAIKKLSPDAVLVTTIRYKDKVMSNLSSDSELKGINAYLL
jgi:FlaA1/EpsC-like NDP-sugar epimerase